MKAVIPKGSSDVMTTVRIEPIGDSEETRITIPSTTKPVGRPSKNENHLVLPKGLKDLRWGRSEYKPEYAEEFLEVYYTSGGSFSRACRQTNTKYAAARQWLVDHPEFDRAIKEVDDLIKDEAHSQFMTRVLNEWEPNPAWKFKYFNKHFPEYSETKKSVAVSFQLKDTLMKPDVVEGVVIKKVLPEHATGSEQSVETPSDPN